MSAAAGRLRGARPIARRPRSADGRSTPRRSASTFAEEPPLVARLGMSPPAALGHHGQQRRDRRARDQPGRRGDRRGDEPSAIDFPPEISEIEVAGLDLAPSDKAAPPCIAQALASLECRRYLTCSRRASAIW
jgi:hypothetical protein